MVTATAPGASAHLAAAIETGLRTAANAERAANEARYLKSDRAFIGCGVPHTRTVVAAFLREHRDADRETLLPVVEALWETGVHECCLAAVILLERRVRLLDPTDMALVERLVRESGTWALVDELAVDVAGGLVEDKPELGEILETWAADENFWVRRAALLALLQPLRRGEGDWEQFTRYADAMLGEREFFIRKAIGWVLREVSKKRPHLVYEWLLPRAGRVSGVTLREAVRYLDAEQRESIRTAAKAG